MEYNHITEEVVQNKDKAQTDFLNIKNIMFYLLTNYLKGKKNNTEKYYSIMIENNLKSYFIDNDNNDIKLFIIDYFIDFYSAANENVKRVFDFRYLFNVDDISADLIEKMLKKISMTECLPLFWQFFMSIILRNKLQKSTFEKPSVKMLFNIFISNISELSNVYCEEPFYCNFYKKYELYENSNIFCINRLDEIIKTFAIYGKHDDITYLLNLYTNTDVKKLINYGGIYFLRTSEIVTPLILTIFNKNFSLEEKINNVQTLSNNNLDLRQYSIENLFYLIVTFLDELQTYEKQNKKNISEEKRKNIYKLKNNIKKNLFYKDNYFYNNNNENHIFENDDKFISDPEFIKKIENTKIFRTFSNWNIDKKINYTLMYFNYLLYLKNINFDLFMSSFIEFISCLKSNDFVILNSSYAYKGRSYVRFYFDNNYSKYINIPLLLFFNFQNIPYEEKYINNYEYLMLYLSSLTNNTIDKSIVFIYFLDCIIKNNKKLGDIRDVIDLLPIIFIVNHSSLPKETKEDILSCFSNKDSFSDNYITNMVYDNTYSYMLKISFLNMFNKYNNESDMVLLQTYLDIIVKQFKEKNNKNLIFCFSLLRLCDLQNISFDNIYLQKFCINYFIDPLHKIIKKLLQKVVPTNCYHCFKELISDIETLSYFIDIDQEKMKDFNDFVFKYNFLDNLNLNKGDN